MSLLCPEAFQEAYRTCLEEFISKTSGKHICIDGKTMRGVKKLSFDTQSHVVSAYSPSDLSALAQVYINRKDSEITAIKKLLIHLDLEGNYLSMMASERKQRLPIKLSPEGLIMFSVLRRIKPIVYKRSRRIFALSFRRISKRLSKSN